MTKTSALFLALWLSLNVAALSQEWRLDKSPNTGWVYEGEKVTLYLIGPPGFQGTVDGNPLFEYSPGRYSALWWSHREGMRAVTLTLRSGQRHDLANIDVEPRSKPRLFTAKELTVTRQGPDADYERLTPLLPGTQVRVDAKRGSWYRSAATGAWIDGRSGAVSDQPAPLSRLSNVFVDSFPNGDAKVTFVCSVLPEIQVQCTASGALAVTLVDTEDLLFELTKTSTAANFLGSITARPLSPTGTVIDIAPGPQGIGGYQLEPGEKAGELILRVRQPVPRSLDGLIVTVDAGHGGHQDTGTVGHGGLAEKELNLRVAKSLARQLQERGATVVMTRTADTEVATQDLGAGHELQARVDVSTAEKAHLFLSLHHNARPSVEEGKTFHGTDIYWYQPFSEPLARALTDPVADAVQEPLRTSRFRSFHVIRQTFSPSVLIEFQYLSNPKLETDILDRGDYPERAAAGVVEGLEAYLKSLP